jgi:hypothetical protein
MSSGLHAGTIINNHHESRYDKHDVRHANTGEGSAVVPVYTNQAYLDPFVSNIPYGTDRRNMMLNHRRRMQRKAENTSIIQDRPMN